MIHIVDYGAGNLGSIQNMLRRIGAQSQIVSNEKELESATKIILPGVGHFDHGMNQLKNSGLIGMLNQKILEEKTPIMGICLGAQMMCKWSEEGDCEGLGWFDAQVKKFKVDDFELRVPHMGWNFINQNKESKISFEIDEEYRKFYFVHSYHIVANKPEEVLFTTNYGYEFVSGLESDNKFAFQFHPEKSHKFGIQIFKNFVAL